MNACKSAQEGEAKFSSVATRLVSLGAKGVVAMAYSVYAVAAKHFIGRMYGELVAGASLSSAVAAGRREVLNQRSRPSPKGNKPLQDWLVPVLYQQESYTPFIPKTTAPSFEELMVTNVTRNEVAIELPDAGAYGFIGRDYDILRLERAFRQNHVVLLKGMGGVGKTELACGFARWLDETQGRTGGIFFTSFADGKGLSYVINTIGRKLGGDRFSQLMSEQQQAVVLQYLQTNPCLLIWDNFEPVAGFPAGNEPLLLETERDSLRQFLKQLRGGQSWVLITSRREEPWLDCGYTLQSLLGLSDADAEELAAKILQSVGVNRAKLPKEYLELLKLLGGHPLSLRVVLPHLKTQNAVQLIDALQKGLDTFQGAKGEGRDKSLTVSLDYSFAKLSERARQHLPFLALFSERVNANLLYAFSGNPDDGNGQIYRAIFRENLQKDDWLILLEEAAEVGILEQIDATIYKIHPALPWYLRQRLSEQHDREVGELEKKLLVFYGLGADYYHKELIGNARLATWILQIEETNLLQNLRLAEQQQNWRNAHFILGALGEVYERIGRKPEFKCLRQRVLKQIGTHLADAKAKGQDAFNFWIYLRDNDANDALAIAELEGARAIYQEILKELTFLNDSSFNHRIAVSYYNLGRVALRQRQFEEAKAFYHQALKIFEDTRNWHSAATGYHELGRIAQEQRQFEEAKAFYHQALKIHEDERNWYYAAMSYHQLGIVAQEQRQFEEAKAFYHQALKIHEDERNWHHAADGYHQLGIVAQEQRQFEEAKAFYLKVLKIYEDARNWYKAAMSYHHLGIVAQEQRQFEEARAFYHKALKIYEDARDWYQAATIYYELGIVAQDQRQFEEAKAFYHKALKIYEDARSWYQAAMSWHNLGMVAQEQRQFEEAKAFYLKALKIYEDARDWYEAADDYHQLGMIAQEQRQFEEAKAFYLKALKIYEDAQDWYKAVNDYYLLAALAEEQRQFEEAKAFYHKAFKIHQQSQNWHNASVTLRQWGYVLEAQENWVEALQCYISTLYIDIEHNKEWIDWRIRDLGRMLKVLGESQFEAIWREVTGDECPEELRSAIQAASEETEE